jgi:hypothetical protein
LASHIEDSNSETTRWLRERCYDSPAKIRDALANYLPARPGDGRLQSEHVGSTQHGTSVSSYRGSGGLVAAATILLLCCTTGCYNHQFQLQEPASPPGIPANSHEHYAKLGVIEFDDMGELRNRCGLSDADVKPCQLEQTLDWIKSQRESAQKRGYQTVVVTFVHGWRHNADPRDENFQRFSIAVQDLQDAADKLLSQCKPGTVGHFIVDGLTITCQGTSPQPLQYIGIYVGWRGKSVVDVPPIAYASLLNRESGAKRVATVSGTEVIYRIRDAAKQPLCDPLNDPCAQMPEGQFVLAGHSFGGLIVERTLAQALTAQIVGGLASDRSYSCASQGSAYKPFADLIVLINPAIEALETQQLIDMMKRSRFHTCPEPGEAIAPPLLVSIKAQDDTATGWGFHVGHYLESFDKSFRHYDESSTLSATADPKVPTQRSVFERTVGSVNYYHKYCYIEHPYAPSGDPVCDNRIETVRAQ